jgi:hypothetical protein
MLGRNELVQDCFAGFYLTRTHAVKTLSATYGHPLVEVVVAGVRSFDCRSAILTAAPVAPVVCVFVFANTEARFWGYLSRSRVSFYVDPALLSQLKQNFWFPFCNTDFKDRLQYSLLKHECSDAVPLAVSFDSRIPLVPHEYFNAYNPVRWPANVEVRRRLLESAITTRFFMFCSAWQSDILDPMLFSVSSRTACVYDAASYQFILSCVSDREFQKMHEYKQVKSRWVEFETAISVQRLRLCASLDRFLPPNTVILSRDDEEVPPLVRRVWPQDLEFVKVPFEHAAAAVRRRDAILQRGQAFVRKNRYIADLASEYMQTIHERNFQNAWGAYPIADSSMQTLCKDIRHRFHRLIACSTESDGLERRATVSLAQMQQHAPPCVKTLLDVAVNTRNPDHLRYEQRQQLSSFLFHYRYSIQEVLHMWAPKMKLVYKTNAVPRDVVTSLKWRYEYTQKARSNTGMNTGTSCWLMTNKCGACPYARDNNSILHLQRAACTKANWPVAKPLPANPIRTPQDLLDVLIDTTGKQTL